MAEDKFVQINVKEEVKREIDIIAATERRFVYEVVEDMLKLYKHVVIGKTQKPRNDKKGKIDFHALDRKTIREELKNVLTQ